jgi:anti-anti-sigma factor
MNQRDTADPAWEGLTISALQVTGEGRWLRLAGEADLRACEALADALAALAEAEENIHLDLTDLTFADVAIARVLARTAAHLDPARKLVLHRVSPLVRRVVELCYADQAGLEIADEPYGTPHRGLGGPEA